MAGRSRITPTSVLWRAIDDKAGGTLAEILAYERRQGTSDRKLAKMLAEQYGFPISVPTVGAWCRALNLPPPVKIKSGVKVSEVPLPPFPEIEETPVGERTEVDRARGSADT